MQHFYLYRSRRWWSRRAALTLACLGVLLAVSLAGCSSQGALETPLPATWARPSPTAATLATPSPVVAASATRASTAAPTPTLPAAPAEGVVDALIRAGGAPFGPAFGAGSVWVGDTRHGTVLRIDPETNEVIATIPTGSSERFDITGESSGIGSPSVFVAATDTAIWATRIVTATTPEYGLVRIDPRSNAVTLVVPLALKPWEIALDGDALWLVARDDNALVRLNPVTGETIATISVTEPRRVAFGFGSIWVASGSKDQGDLDWVPYGGPYLTRIDRTTQEVVALVPIERGASDVVVTADAVWVSSTDGPIYRIDPQSNAVVDTVPVMDIQFMTTDGDHLWANHPGSRTVQRIDVADGTVTIYRAGSIWGSVAVGYGAVWVTRFTRGEIGRIDLEGATASRVRTFDRPRTPPT